MATIMERSGKQLQKHSPKMQLRCHIPEQNQNITPFSNQNITQNITPFSRTSPLGGVPMEGKSSGLCSVMFCASQSKRGLTTPIAELRKGGYVLRCSGVMFWTSQSKRGLPHAHCRIVRRGLCSVMFWASQSKRGLLHSHCRLVRRGLCSDVFWGYVLGLPKQICAHLPPNCRITKRGLCSRVFWGCALPLPKQTCPHLPPTARLCEGDYVLRCSGGLLRASHSKRVASFYLLQNCVKGLMF